MSVLVKKDIVIKDACILIDLIDLGLMPLFYELELVVITTPLVIGEIKDLQQSEEVNVFVTNGKLHIDREGDLAVLTTIIENHRGLSIADASVLEVAGRIGATVLSSDGSLRNISARQGLVVRGLLWVLEEIYLNQLIDLPGMLEKLSLYPKVNNRAPKKEIQLLVDKYSGNT